MPSLLSRLLPGVGSKAVLVLMTLLTFLFINHFVMKRKIPLKITGQWLNSDAVLAFDWFIGKTPIMLPPWHPCAVVILIETRC